MNKFRKQLLAVWNKDSTKSILSSLISILAGVLLGSPA